MADRLETAHWALTIFLSALLLFLIQPLIARIILPWFGGSASVWAACMLFFQAGLLLGYLYSHWSATTLSPRAQARVHGALLLASAGLRPWTDDYSSLYALLKK